MNEFARSYHFPETFLFGTGNAAHQCELKDLAPNDYNRALKEDPLKNHFLASQQYPNWWDEKEAIADFETMATLGFNSQRLGIEWARIYPEKGKLDKIALSRYQRLVAALHALDLKPMITINHYTLPLWVADSGGWENEKIASYFSDYTKLLTDHFGDVSDWITINEPNVVLFASFLTKVHPPFKSDPLACIKARTNMIKSHDQAYKVIKQQISNAAVGTANHYIWYEPLNDLSPLDQLAATVGKWICNQSVTDAMAQSADFIGVNYYTRFNIRFNPLALKTAFHPEILYVPKYTLFSEALHPHQRISDAGWGIDAASFLKVLQFVAEKYHKPIDITENGIADRLDKWRPFYFLTHLWSVTQAMQRGINIRAYRAWSTVDTREHLELDRIRTGLIAVNYQTGERKIRESAYLLGEIAREKKIDLFNLANRYLPNDQKILIPELLKSFESV